MIGSTLQLYRNAYDGLSRRIWLLGVVMLINRSGTMVLAFMTLYCTRLGYSIKQAGFVVALYGLGSIAGALLGGKISDKFGFYNTQVGALFFGGVLFIVLGQMQSFSSICICTFFLSMVNESFRPANATAIAHYSTPRNRTQSYSLVRLAINIGWGIGSALGGFLASINYHLLFWADGITNMVAACILLLILPRVTVSQQRPPSVSAATSVTRASPFKDSTFLLFWVFTLLFSICFFQMFTTVPLFFKEQLRMDEFWIGVVMAFNGIFIALFEMVIVYKLEGRIPYLRLMCYGALLMAASFLLLDIPFLFSLLISFLFIITITIAEIVAMPFMNSYYISRTNEFNRGQYAGLYTMAWSAAQVIGSSAGSYLAYKAGFRSLWLIIAVTALISAAGYSWLQKRE